MGGYHTCEKNDTMTYQYNFTLPGELLEQDFSQGGEHKLGNKRIPQLAKTK
jgi:hypothetical protein